jgi:hypothetical protein
VGPDTVGDGGVVKDTWTQLDDLPDSQRRLTFEEQQREWQRQHYPKLWEWAEEREKEENER